MKTNLALFALLLLLVMCRRADVGVFDDINNRFVNKGGQIVRNVCSRGCYQYFIEINHNGSVFLLSPNAIDKYFEKDGLKIRFTGQLSGAKMRISTPGANDIPLEGDEIPIVNIEEMVER